MESKSKQPGITGKSAALMALYALVITSSAFGDQNASSCQNAKSAQAATPAAKQGSRGTRSRAAGGDHSGGGDLSCAHRIELIRNNLEEWIKQGEASHLDFKDTGATLEEYNVEMSSLIDLTRQEQSSISCTDNPKKVIVNGAERICKASWTSTKTPRILCYRGEEKGGKITGGLMGMSGKEQYGQIHHEFAVLAGFEDQSNEYSNYLLSGRISENTTIITLWLLPVASSPTKPMIAITEVTPFSEGVFRLRGAKFMDRYRLSMDSSPRVVCEKAGYHNPTYLDLWRNGGVATVSLNDLILFHADGTFEKRKETNYVSLSPSDFYDVCRNPNGSCQSAQEAYRNAIAYRENHSFNNYSAYLDEFYCGQ